ncbi:MAG: FAD-dependent oxidoreductase [bacterium]|nr:FAD-dependent oxidoreductase [bacterium]
MSQISPTHPHKLENVEQWHLETDVAIVGFGGAGGCAAIEAADQGADVTIFEVAAGSGGSTALSSAEIYMGGGGGTRVQRACGYDDSTEDLFNYLMLAQGDLADEERIRLFAEGSLDHFDWIVGLGIPYKDSEFEGKAIVALTDDCLLYTGNEKAWPFCEIAKPCPRGHNIEVEGDNGGPIFMKIVTQQVESRGARIEYNARVLKLIADEHGEVFGLVVRIDGEERNVRARKGVILATGGFAMNQEMWSRYSPTIANRAVPIGNPFDDGSGIRMGQGAGGSLLHMDQSFVTIPYYPPASHTFGILVNSQGQRFINEDVYHARIAANNIQQLETGESVYLIIGEKNWQQPNMLGGEIETAGDEIEEIAEDIGLPVANLAHTFNHYNTFAAKGEDPLFHKAAEWLEPIEPTIAAVDITPGQHGIYVGFTLGGLETKTSGEVLTMDGDIVPGLYAAGRATCGVPRRAEGYGSGLSVGDVTFFGRLAGGQVARRERG